MRSTFGFVRASSAHHLAPNTAIFERHNLRPVSYWLPLKGFLHHLLTMNAFLKHTEELHTHNRLRINVCGTSLIYTRTKGTKSKTIHVCKKQVLAHKRFRCGLIFVHLGEHCFSKTHCLYLQIDEVPMNVII